jgi:hypothetical protein
MIGRCGRKLPIDEMLPRVVHSARFSPEQDRPRPASEPARPSWPYARSYAQAHVSWIGQVLAGVGPLPFQT